MCRAGTPPASKSEFSVKIRIKNWGKTATVIQAKTVYDIKITDIYFIAFLKIPEQAEQVYP